MAHLLSRRRLLSATCSGLGLGLLGAPVQRALAATEGTPRKLLVIFCTGGWDTTYFFATGTDSEVVDGDPNGTDSVAGDIPFVDSEDRLSARAFMDSWSGELCVINGLEVHSVSHTVCEREMITGNIHAEIPDWPALVARERGAEHTIPLLHFSGPSFPQEAGNMVVRVGANQQLPRLLSGEAMIEASLPSKLRDADVSAIEDAFVNQRIQAGLAQSGRGLDEALFSSALSAEARMQSLVNSPEAALLGTANTLSEQGLLIVDAFAAGLAHAGIIAFKGDFGWDTHGENHQQSTNFEKLFVGLNDIILALAENDGTEGGSLLDETMVVVVSEMGRYPKLNSREGKDHWTFTSAMLIGGGVAGGQVLGGYDEQFEGMPFDLATGTLGDGGLVPTPANLYSTVLENCGIDSTDWFPDDPPILSALRS